ncbi:hypothetical protein TSAR_011552 [Trichomalopsis sarcophagae]|uniref:Uncharacterized protein n=1 Tax=Trichomalopsis sarcophagae TaxID=543379 RepID=A0A232EIK9_9HYME|nr:hypothetical protein TSAR_011552 [Trichomalopsis sarcophagae]
MFKFSTATTTDSTSVSAAASAPTSHVAAVEKIKLPTFDGKHSEWDSFKGKFTALIISDTQMAPVLKLQRLYNCLEGEALSIIRGIKSSADTFDAAWNKLLRQYDNKQVRFSKQMELLINLPVVQEESVQCLNLALVTIDESTNVFTSLERPVKHWDDIFIHCVKASPTHFGIEDLETRLEMLEELWREFAARDTILKRSSEQLKGRTYFKEDMFVGTATRYMDAKS